MPRGRAGLTLIPPELVARAVYGGDWRGGRYRRGELVRAAAAALGVTERTIRRSLERGLVLMYGRKWISRDAWEAFELARGVRPRSSADKSESALVPRARAPRSSVDRHLSERRRSDKSRRRRRA